jgi:hypothetical protein
VVTAEARTRVLCEEMMLLVLLPIVKFGNHGVESVPPHDANAYVRSDCHHVLAYDAL